MCFLEEHVVEDVEGLVVAGDDERGAVDVQRVDGERLRGQQRGRLHPVLDSLVAEPQRRVVREVRCKN